MRTKPRLAGGCAPRQAAQYAVRWRSVRRPVNGRARTRAVRFCTYMENKFTSFRLPLMYEMFSGASPLFRNPSSTLTCGRGALPRATVSIQQAVQHSDVYVPEILPRQSFHQRDLGTLQRRRPRPRAPECSKAESCVALSLGTGSLPGAKRRRLRAYITRSKIHVAASSLCRCGDASWLGMKAASPRPGESAMRNSPPVGMPCAEA